MILAHLFFTLENCLILAVMLFAIGAYGVLTRRNLLVVLMSLELMLNAVNLSAVSLNFFRGFAVFGREDGQMLALFVIAVAAAEAAVGLAILVTIFRNRDSVDAEQMQELSG